MGFTAPQAARLTGASRAQLDAWSRVGLVHAGPDYEFADLVTVRLVVALLDAGLSPARLRPALRHRGGGERDSAARLVTDGDDIWLCDRDADVLAALRRLPLAFVVDVAPFVAATQAAVAAFDAERRGFVESLRVG